MCQILAFYDVAVLVIGIALPVCLLIAVGQCVDSAVGVVVILQVHLDIIVIAGSDCLACYELPIPAKAVGARQIFPLPLSVFVKLQSERVPRSPVCLVCQKRRRLSPRTVCQHIALLAGHGNGVGDGVTARFSGEGYTVRAALRRICTDIGVAVAFAYGRPRRHTVFEIGVFHQVIGVCRLAVFQLEIVKPHRSEAVRTVGADGAADGIADIIVHGGKHALPFVCAGLMHTFLYARHIHHVAVAPFQTQDRSVAVQPDTAGVNIRRHGIIPLPRHGVVLADQGIGVCEIGYGGARHLHTALADIALCVVMGIVRRLPLGDDCEEAAEIRIQAMVFQEVGNTFLCF